MKRYTFRQWLKGIALAIREIAKLAKEEANGSSNERDENCP